MAPGLVATPKRTKTVIFSDLPRMEVRNPGFQKPPKKGREFETRGPPIRAASRNVLVADDLDAADGGVVRDGGKGNHDLSRRIRRGGEFANNGLVLPAGR